MAKKYWIDEAIGSKGALHRDLGMGEDEEIPLDTLRAAAKRGNKMGARARLALTLRKFNPWEVMKDEEGWWVVEEGTTDKVHSKPHANREEAVQHMRALYAAEGIGDAESKMRNKKRMMEGDEEEEMGMILPMKDMNEEDMMI